MRTHHRLITAVLLTLLFLPLIADAAPRRKYRGVARDNYGNVLAASSVTVKVQSTGGLATIYTTQSGATPATGSIVTADSTGAFELWLDSHDYALGTVFQFVVSKSGYTTQTISNVAVDAIGYGGELE